MTGNIKERRKTSNQSLEKNEKENNYMIYRMYMTLAFDKTINKGTVSISPGGYEFITNDDRTFKFDFFTSYGGIDDENMVHFEARELDTDTFPESKHITVDELNNIKKFTEFYVDIEDTESPETAPVLIGIRDVVIEYYDKKENRTIPVEIPDELFTKDLLNEINEANNIQTPFMRKEIIIQ